MSSTLYTDRRYHCFSPWLSQAMSIDGVMMTLSPTL